MKFSTIILSLFSVATLTVASPMLEAEAEVHARYAEDIDLVFRRYDEAVAAARSLDTESQELYARTGNKCNGGFCYKPTGVSLGFAPCAGKHEGGAC